MALEPNLEAAGYGLVYGRFVGGKMKPAVGVSKQVQRPFDG